MNSETRKAMAHIHGDYPPVPGETEQDIAARNGVTRVKPPRLSPDHPVALLPCPMDGAKLAEWGAVREHLYQSALAISGVPDSMLRQQFGAGPAITGLRPPLEHADKPWHWIERDGQREPGLWINGGWLFVGKIDLLAPTAAVLAHHRYLGPVDWHATLLQDVLSAMHVSQPPAPKSSPAPVYRGPLHGPGWRYDPVANRTYAVPVDAKTLDAYRRVPPAEPKAPAKPPLPAAAVRPSGVKTGLFVR